MKPGDDLNRPLMRLVLSKDSGDLQTSEYGFGREVIEPADGGSGFLLLGELSLPSRVAYDGSSDGSEIYLPGSDAKRCGDI